ncbi:MAG: EamA family transporter [Candidatus Cloacimonetes bacterium]|nr:EamA family transporter [Candidatus Cloacimonadota bacterium]
MFNLKLLLLMSVQSLFLVASQIVLKTGIGRLKGEVVNVKYFLHLAISPWVISSALLMGVAAGIWVLVLRNYDFNQAYPLVSISYVFALVAAIVVFGEDVPAIRWIGVLVIMVGVFLILKVK